MTRATNRDLPLAVLRPFSCAKNTPGERCNWLTMTRSVPLMTKVPCSVMSGTSPRYTFCSFTSRMSAGSLPLPFSRTTKRTMTRRGSANVMPFCRHSARSYLVR